MRGSARSRKEQERRWKRAWRELPQERIQMWIEGVYNNVQEVLRLQGGNEYKEGRAATIRQYKGLRIKGILSPHAYLNANTAILEGGDVVDDFPFTGDGSEVPETPRASGTNDVE